MIKKILIVTPYFAPHTGGLERYVNTVVEQIGKSVKWEVVVLTTSEDNLKDEVITTDTYKMYRLRYSKKIFNTPVSLNWVNKIRKILKDEQPDIVNIHTPVPGLGDMVSFLVSSKIPIVITYHSGSMKKGTFVADTIIFLYEHLLLPLMLHKASRIICSSLYVQEVFLSKYKFKSTTITPGVDTDVFSLKPQSIQSHQVLLFVAPLGKFEQYKGLSVLLKAMTLIVKSNPTILLKVIGDGDMREEYQNKTKALGINNNVKFMGILRGSALVEAYHSATMLVHPSSNDSSPTVIIEAMAVGLPVVSTLIGGIPDIVEDGVSGYLVSAGNSNALAAKVIELLADKEKMMSFAKRGYEIVLAKYTWDARIQHYTNILDNLTRDYTERKVKLLMVSPYLYPKIGGVEKFVYELVRNLDATNKYDISLVTSNINTDKYELTYLNTIPVHNLPMRWKISNSPVDFSTFFWMKKIIKSIKPDIIHAHAPVPFFSEMSALNAKNIKFLQTYHSGKLAKGVWYIDSLLWFYEKYVLKLLFKRSDAITTVSDTTRNEILSSYLEKVTVISPGVTLPNSDKIKIVDNDKKLITYVGRIETSSQWKGIDVLVKAFAVFIKENTNFQLQIVGEGDAVPMYKQLVADLKIEKNVVFRGTLTGRSLEEAYLKSLVVILPSLSSAESFGMVLLEAMALGVPVIGSNIGGIKNLISHEFNGLLVQPGNIEDLARSIERMTFDENLRKLCITNGIKVAQNLSWDSQANKFMNLYENLLRIRK